MLIISTLYLLCSSAVSNKKNKSILFSRSSLIILLYCLFISMEGLYISCLDKGLGLYGGLFQITSNAQSFQAFIFIVSIIIITLTSFYPRKVWIKNSILSLKKIKSSDFFKDKITNLTGEQFKIIEYPLILLFIITGACLLLSSSDIVSIFLSIELQSYGLYLISTIYRNSESSTSGGLTYFLLGGLSSCFILLGTSLIYANSGITYLDGIYIINNMCNIDTIDFIQWYNSNYIISSLVIIAIGFLFKVSAAPFHFWSPEVYDAIPTVVTTFVVIVAKISIFMFLLELVFYTNISSDSKYSWTYCLLFSSLLSLVIGTIAGLTQYRIKRLFAYSTISHVGFLLMALSINSMESIQAFIFYLIQYTLSNLNAFIILSTMGFYLYNYRNYNKKFINISDKNNSPIQYISQIKGYFYLNPLLAVSLAITFYSFMGIPPLIGFFGKQLVLSSALDSGYIFLALVGIITSVISAVYYLMTIKQMFFSQTESKIIDIKDPYYIIDKKNSFSESLSNKSYSLVISSFLSFIIISLNLILLLFILMPQELLNISMILSIILYS